MVAKDEEKTRPRSANRDLNCAAIATMSDIECPALSPA
jgi:hypothetical protein